MKKCVISGSIYRKNRIKRCCHRVIFYKYNDVKSRVSFSPVKKVLRYSPMDSVAKLGNNKKRAVLISLSTNMPQVPLILFHLEEMLRKVLEHF